MTGLETGAGFGLEFVPGVAAGSVVVGERGSVAGTGPEPGDAVGFGSGAVAVTEFGPETEPGVEIGPGAVGESGVGFEPVFEMKPVPGGSTEAGPLFGAGPGPAAGSRFGFGTETAPEVDFEQWAVLGHGAVAEVVAETELGPGGGFGLAPGDGLESECEAFVGLGQRAGPESVHGSGFDAGVEVEQGFGAGAEAAWV